MSKKRALKGKSKPNKSKRGPRVNAARLDGKQRVQSKAAVSRTRFANLVGAAFHQQTRDDKIVQPVKTEEPAR